MSNLQNAIIKTAGAYINIGGLYPFVIGWKLHNGNIPVVRLGGHIQEKETGWQCATREIQEEAKISIEPAFIETTYLVNVNEPDHILHDIDWHDENQPDPKPLIVAAYPVGDGCQLSLMYLARSTVLPKPSSEVKGILLLDPANIHNICHSTITLDQYLERGGKAILHHDFDGSCNLEPFLQLRILSKLLEAQLV